MAGQLARPLWWRRGHTRAVDIRSYLREKFGWEVGELRSRSLSPEELRQHDDARWARHDPAVQAQFCGQFVVPHERQVTAHGTDPRTVLAEAAHRSGRRPHELVLIGIGDPLADMPS